MRIQYFVYTAIKWISELNIQDSAFKSTFFNLASSKCVGRILSLSTSREHCVEEGWEFMWCCAGKNWWIQCFLFANADSPSRWHAANSWSVIPAMCQIECAQQGRLCASSVFWVTPSVAPAMLIPVKLSFPKIKWDGNLVRANWYGSSEIWEYWIY